MAVFWKLTTEECENFLTVYSWTIWQRLGGKRDLELLYIFFLLKTLTSEGKNYPISPNRAVKGYTFENRKVRQNVCSGKTREVQPKVFYLALISYQTSIAPFDPQNQSLNKQLEHSFLIFETFCAISFWSRNKLASFATQNLLVPNIFGDNLVVEVDATIF